VTTKFVTLHNSKRLQPAGARSKDDVRPDEIIRVTVVVRSISSAEERKKAITNLSLQIPSKRKYLAPKDFNKLHGARNEDLQLVKKFAEHSKLRVIESSKERRCVILSGTAQQLSDAFQVDNRTYTHEGQVYRSYPDAIQIPASLKGIIEAVLGLEDRPLMSHHAFLAAAQHKIMAAGGVSARHTEVREVAEAYKFPTGANGKGQCIAIIELGGGFYESDIKKYFRTHKLHQPKISVVEIEGARNNPADPKYVKQVLEALGVEHGSDELDKSKFSHAMWTIESTLDVQLAGSFANAANIVVYYAPNNAHGKYQAITAALSSKKYPTSVISCSWGAVEETLPGDVVSSLNHVFQDAALRGVTICFSSGDRGENLAPNGKPRVQFPASSPYVLSCGGTHWLKRERSIYEEVWNESLPKNFVAQSGGGVSKIFEQPEWQSGIRLQTRKSGRGVPDVAGKADIVTGYCMQVAGFDVTMGGTSAAAPMWAGLIARLNQELGCSIGYMNPFFYKSCGSSFNDITKGNNGKHFKATPGWDPCTGWGSPDGKKLLAKLRGK
jgi:kumamolisin